MRDLYWACFSEPLLSTDYNVASYEVVKRYFPHLDQWFLDLDACPDPLHEHLAKLKSTRLGIYFEALWEYYLRYAGVADLIVKNHQIIDSKKTLGEFDFIYYCHRRRKAIHLETAAKFYLGIPSGADLESSAPTNPEVWIGPGCRDRLDIKASALFQRQLPLSKTEQGVESLKQFAIGHIEQELCLNGIFFYPQMDNATMHSPQGAHPKHRRCLWINNTCFKPAGSEYWALLSRQQWFSLNFTDTCSKLISSSELSARLREYFHIPKNPPIQLVSMEQLDGYWLEKQRYYITPDNWPRL